MVSEMYNVNNMVKYIFPVSPVFVIKILQLYFPKETCYVKI